MSGSHDFQVADIYNDLTDETIISRWDIDYRSGLPAVIYIRVRLPVLDVRNDAVNYRSDILEGISLRPLGHFVVIFMDHFGSSLKFFFAV